VGVMSHPNMRWDFLYTCRIGHLLGICPAQSANVVLQDAGNTSLPSCLSPCVAHNNASTEAAISNTCSRNPPSFPPPHPFFALV
jgi:hypothetical protein